jgi:kynurenine 3-monooxygenase
MPRWYLPLYVMIEFPRIPYRDAVQRAWRQDWIVAGVGLGVAAVIVSVVAWLVLR